jgi:hypothetical protein
VRELYGRVALSNAVDVEAGKRLVRWGTGYGFAPTGVLDPPRDPTDPGDRLRRNEGQVFVRADVFRGATSLTVALAAPQLWRTSPASAPDRRVGARLRSTIAGLEIAAVASAAPGEGPSWGGNLTHVVGQRLEWHAELLVHDAGAPWTHWLDPGHAPRSWSAVLGAQYTLPGVGGNVVLEYHRDGWGLNDAQWARVLDARARRWRPSSQPPNAAPRRRDFLFTRLAPVTGEGRIVPELIVIASLDDGGWTLVPSLSANMGAHVQAYVRPLWLLGPRDSVNGGASSRAGVTSGLTLRF